MRMMATGLLVRLFQWIRMSEHKNVSYDLKFRLLYYDAAGNNRYKLKSTCVFDLFIHNACGYFSAWEESMIQRVLLIYLGITLEHVLRKIKSTQ